MQPEKILKKYWGYDDFRPLQPEIIQSVLDNQDTLALLPTGGGKSICFQIPGLILDGVTIVITPLIALMKDQVDQLKQRNISAAAIFSGMHKSEIDRTLDNFVNGDYKFLYVSPERLLTEIMIERSKKMSVSLLVIDEAHCISKWGHDFRPPYLRIQEFRQYIPKATVIALTATATENVKKDILNSLGIEKAQVFTKSFARSNLSFASLKTEQKEQRLFQILNKYKGSSIVYVKTRKRTAEVALFLNKMKFKADFYHAGLSNEERSKKQKTWIESDDAVVVSTNAFGMGIDKANVRSVVHLDVPENIEAYYQEAGRAGRDGKQAYAFLLFNYADIDEANRWLELRFPPIEKVRRVYQCLCNYYQLAVGSVELESKAFDLRLFCETFGLNTTETHYCLKLLEENALISLSDAYFNPSRLMIKVTNRELYGFQVQNEQLGALSKTILRIYGGEIFSNFLTISEFEIARGHSIPTDRVISSLLHLKQLNLVDYFQQSNSAQLTFLKSRYDANTLQIDIEAYKKKQKHETYALNRMLQYTQEGRKCRMAMMQEYFDEFNAVRCGKCDNCLGLEQLKLAESEKKQMFESIEKLLPNSISKLSLQFANEDVFILEKVVQDSIKHGFWSMDQTGTIYKSEE